MRIEPTHFIEQYDYIPAVLPQYRQTYYTIQEIRFLDFALEVTKTYKQLKTIAIWKVKSKK